MYALYQFDCGVRESVRSALEQFEQTFKQNFAYVIGKEISVDQDIYTREDLFNAESGNARQRLIRQFSYVLHNNNYEPYHHYREDHNNIPPWIMIKDFSFGNMEYWYKLSGSDIRKNVVSRLLGLKREYIEEQDSSLQIMSAFSDLLELYRVYRNKSSHVSRLYDTRLPGNQIRQYSPFLYDNIMQLSHNRFLNGEMRSSIGTVLVTLQVFENKVPFVMLQRQLINSLVAHLIEYPDDYNFLMTKMELIGTPIELELTKHSSLRFNGGKCLGKKSKIQLLFQNIFVKHEILFNQLKH